LNKNKKRRPSLIVIVGNVLIPYPLIANLDEAFTCEIQRKNTTRVEREVAIWAVLASDS
jgi:hypothetical protein